MPFSEANATSALISDMIDSATGKSIIVPGQRPSYLQWNVTVVKTNDGWKFGDATNETVLKCPG